MERRWSGSRLQFHRGSLCLATALVFFLGACVDDGGALAPEEERAANRSNLVVAPDAPEVFWVLLKQKPDLSRSPTLDWTNRGRHVHGQLTGTASTTQAPLRAWLSARGVRHEPFWVVNAIKVTADRATRAEIARRADVDRILADKSYDVPPIARGRAVPRLQNLEWGLSNIRAPEIWSSFGARGCC